MSMFSGLSKEVSNWLPVGKKNDDEEEEVPSPKLGNEAATLPDEKASATGGADSDIHASEGELDGEDGGIGGVSTKAIQGAKNIKSFLFSAVNKAGKTVSEAGAKIKKTVEENDILGNFNKEGEGGKDKAKPGEAVPPWVGHPNQESLKEECLSLSKDRRNFVRSPPPGVDFDFDYEAQYPVAQAVLAEDPLLEKMKEELVPKLLSEETFWRNYFYRVSLICQANEMEQESSETRNSTEPDSTA
uniref:Synapse-associated protein of 47 kDa n=1 Tax=Cacopsylla melanoneura TaxID=428564 RepID=A0A8D8T346_9HEMI